MFCSPSANMEDRRRQSTRFGLMILGLFLSVFIIGANGTCRNITFDPEANYCSFKAFSECSTNERGNIHVTSATVTVGSGLAVDATDAADSIIQCSDNTCRGLVYFLLSQYSQQFCFILDETYGPSNPALMAMVTVSYTGGSQPDFSETFNGFNDNSYFNGGSFQSCTSFKISSTPGPTLSPSPSSSLNVYEHNVCNGQAAATTPSATPQPSTTQPPTTQPPTTRSPTTQLTTAQPPTTQPVVSLNEALTSTAADEGRCETFKIGATRNNCLPQISLCRNPDININTITVLNATLQISRAAPVDITRLTQNIIRCSHSACEGVIYEVVQIYSRDECLRAVDSTKTISIDVVYTYGSFTFSVNASHLFTIDEDGLQSQSCDNLYYEQRPNTTSNSVENPFNCSSLDGSRYEGSSETTVSTEKKPGCPRVTVELVEGVSLGVESCGATFTITSDSLNNSNARVSFASIDKNDVVGGPNNVLHEGIDSSGNHLHLISLVIVIDIETGNETLELDGSVVIDFAVDRNDNSDDIYCAFIANESAGIWSSEGMERVFANSTLVQCRSNHLTSFAVLLSAKPPQGIHALIQSYLSRVMGALSVLSLTLAVFIFFATGTWKLLKIQIHMNLAISTALGQLLFMTMAEMTWNRIICKTIAVALQYLFTSALAWTMIEGVFLYRTTAVGFKPLRIGWLSLCAWGGSLVVVGVSFGVLYDGYVSTSYCWLRHDDNTIYVFVGCVFAVLLFNSMILFFVMKSFLSLKANAKKDEIDKIKALARALLILLPILGLTWFSGTITSITTSNDVIFFQYLFVISFGLQGICILIFHCLQVPDVKSNLKNRFHRRIQDSTWASKTGPRSTATSSF